MTCEPNRKRSITSAVATLVQDPENTSTYTHEGITGLQRIDPGGNRKNEGTSSRVTTRPIVKLYPLEVIADDISCSRALSAMDINILISCHIHFV